MQMGFLFANPKLKLLIAISIGLNVFFWQNLQANQYAQTKVVYSLADHPNQEIIDLLQESGQFAYFSVYTLTRQDISDALIAAKLRGLEVQGILDYNQSLIEQEKPIIKKLQKYGIPLEIPLKKDDSLMHTKFVVTDAGYASGSYNWTTSATSYNDEVLEIGKVESIRQQYLKIFNLIWKKYSN